MCVLPSYRSDTLSPRGEWYWGERGSCVLSANIGAWFVAILPPSEIWSSSYMPPVQSPVMAAPSVLRRCLGFEPPPSVMAALTVVLEHLFGSDWCMCQVSGRKPFSQLFSFSRPLCPASRTNKCSHTRHEQSTGFPQPSYQSPSGPWTSQGCSSSLCWIPGLGRSICG